MLDQLRRIYIEFLVQNDDWWKFDKTSLKLKKLILPHFMIGGGKSELSMIYFYQISFPET